MKVLITTQVFPPEMHPTAVMVDQLSAAFAECGEDVTVAAGWPHHPYGRVPAGWKKRLLAREQRGGVELVRGWHFTSERRSVVARALVMASQALGTAIVALCSRAPDAVVNFGPPLVGSLTSIAVARLRRARCICVIYDLYPDILIESGKLRSPLAIRALRALERAMYRGADRIVVLSEGFRRRLVERGVPPDKIEVIPVWLDPDEIKPGPRANAWRQQHGIPVDAKVVLYAGTIGLISGAAVMLKAAERLRARHDIRFVFVGEGQVKDELELEARRKGLANVAFFPLQPRDQVANVQAIADVSVVTLASGRGRTSVPSKVVGYMAAGRPVVAAVDDDSDTAAAIREAECGAVVPPDAPELLAEAIQTMLDSPERPLVGDRARRYFEATYAERGCIERFRAVVRDVVAGGGDPVNAEGAR